MVHDRLFDGNTVWLDTNETFLGLLRRADAKKLSFKKQNNEGPNIPC
jgi:hypothetical protein